MEQQQQRERAAPPFTLNPKASVFVPSLAEEGFARGPSLIAHDEAQHPRLLDLPPEMIQAVLGHLPDVRDVLSSGMACRQLLQQVACAELRLDLSCTGFGDPASGTAAPRAAPPALQLSSSRSSPAQLVNTLPKLMPGLVHLDLSGQALEDSDVLSLLAALPRLRHLELASCRKLTCHFTSALVRRHDGGHDEAASRVRPAAGAEAPSAKHASVPDARPMLAPQLRALNLQRCFQLRGSALSELLHGAHCGFMPSLGVLAMSHLDLAQLALVPALLTPPAATAAALPAASQPSTEAGASSDAAAAAVQAETATLSSTSTSTCPVTPVTPASSSSPLTSFSRTSSSSSSSSSSSCSDTALQPAVCPSGGMGPMAALTVLALNNCSGLSLRSLVTLGALCPQLRYLMLGGCTWLLTAPATTGNSGGEQAGNALAAAAEGVWQPAATMPGGSTDGRHGTGSGAAAGSSTLRDDTLQRHQRMRSAVTQLSPDLCQTLQAHGQGWGLGVARSSSRPALCGSRAPRGTPLAADAPWMAEAAATLAAVLLELPALCAVELSFFPPPVLSRVAAAFSLLGGGGGGLQPRSSGAQGRLGHAAAPQLWDLTLASGVDLATQALTQHEAAAGVSSGGSPSASAPAASGPRGCRQQQGQDQVSGLRLALRCAANCSNGARATPAHAAAERGDERALRGLLALGACADSKERGGAGPVFLAAEAGHVACVAALLEAGASPQMANAAGERPLYIAALRGHLPVVKLLLAHCQALDIPWQDTSLYGDSWTPLMAAAVADRVDVAQALLRAASTSTPGNPAAASALVSAINRYGQCVLHIAARKASGRLLRLLLSHCCCACSCPACLAEEPHTPEEQHQLLGSAHADECDARCPGADGMAPGASSSSGPRHALGARSSVEAQPSGAAANGCAPAVPATPQHRHRAPHKCAVVLADSNGHTPLDVARNNRNASAVAELTRAASGALPRLAPGSMSSSCGAGGLVALPSHASAHMHCASSVWASGAHARHHHQHHHHHHQHMPSSPTSAAAGAGAGMRALTLAASAAR